MKNSENEGSIEVVVMGVIAALILAIAFPLCISNQRVLTSQVQNQQIR